MKKKMKILYLMCCEWNWIFQRPHIFALELEKYFDCTVINKKILFSKKTTVKNRKPKKLINILQLRGEGKLYIIRIINYVYMKIRLSHFTNYDIIWTNYPNQIELLNNKYKGIVVYDCMDNYESMTDIRTKKEVVKNEIKLINRSNIVFTSSDYLRKRILSKNPEKKVRLVRNGSYGKINGKPKEAEEKINYRICYIGTISKKWFDFNLLELTKDYFENISYALIGPLDEINQIDCSKYIDYLGVVEHKNLDKYIERFDAVIMPFVVNETVLAVDPVKLYEYISFGKCIISIWYPEIDRFSKFVYFYSNKDEYISLLRMLISNKFKPKYNENDQNYFLNNNTWQNRSKIIVDEIDKIINDERQ